VLALVLRVFVLDAYRIPSGSMADTLLPGDFLLVNKLVYGAATPRVVPFTSLQIPFFRFPGLSSPRRGDVVVFVLDGTTYVKRCVALPGDTVFVRGSTVLVNGREVPLPGTARIPDEHAFWNLRTIGPLTIPRCGDRLTPKRGSTTFLLRLIEREGHTAAVTPGGTLVVDGRSTDAYTVAGDQYFMLGDNRDNSLDSRINGFVPATGIIGKAMLVYWSRAVPPDMPGGIRWSRLGTLIR